MSRGELLTVYADVADGLSVKDVRAVLNEAYADEPFVRIVSEGVMPGTQHVRGSNTCLIGVYEDRVPGRVVLVSTLDNLVKGSSGQALQNMNVMFGIEETTGLGQQPLFP